MPIVQAVDCPLVFYTNPMSRGRIVRWMLEEVGEDYRQEVIDYGAAMKTPAYLAINPMGKVPALAHRGAIITECAAICAYLADAFPASRLAPALEARADYFRWLFFAAGPLEAALVDRTLGVEVPADKQGMVGYGTYDTVVDVFEAAISRKPFVAGDAFSAADVYVGSHVIWGLQFGSLPARASFEDYAARLTSRAAYQRAREIDDALLPASPDGGQ